MDKRERLELLIKAQSDTKLQSLLIEKCRRDPHYWFNTFCWTVDPRTEGASFIPFELYPYQEWVVDELVRAIQKQQDLGIEKSRDMGVSWLVILVFQWFWLFYPNRDFHVGSRNEKEVCDASENHSTLLGKFRINLHRLPEWMKPDYRDKNLLIWNQTNGNFMTGESANAFFGRGGRKRSILLDEFAFWPDAESAWTSASESTNCRIVTSTPQGSTNKYASLMLDRDNDVQNWPGLHDEMIRKGLISAA